MSALTLRTMKKIILVFPKGLLCGVGFWLLASVLCAQQIGMFSHYFYKPMIYNPAFAGSDVGTNVMLINHTQWSDFKGAPQLNILTVDRSYMNNKMGLGAALTSDRKGITARTGGNLFYSYRIKLNDDMYLLSGLSFGILYQTLDFSKAVMQNTSDVPLFSGSQHKTSYDGNAGLVFVWKEVELGAAVPQLFGNKINYVGNGNVRTYYTQARHYMGSIKYKYFISSDKNISIAPQGLARFVSNTPLQYDGNVNFDWKNIFWIGATYKSDYAVAANAGFCFHKQFSFGYSYDIIIGNIGKYSGISHEIMLNLRFGKHLIAAQERLKTEQDILKAKHDRAKAAEERAKALVERAIAEQERAKAQQEKAKTKRNQSKTKQEKAKAQQEKAKVELEKAKAELERAKAEQELVKAEEERAKAEQERVKAEQERLKAEEESAKAEQERLKAEQERVKAEQESAKAEQERVKVEQERLKAEQERVKAEEEKAKEEQERVRAEQEKAKTEEERVKAEQEKAKAEEERVKAEQDKAKAEEERVKSQQDMAKAEQERMKAEQERLKAEQEKAKTEEEKAKAEQERVKMEQEKAKAEQGRLKAEQERAKTEEEKAKAEQGRLKSEQDKAKAEQERLKSEQDKAKAEQERLKAEQEKARTEQERVKAEQEKAKAEQERMKAEQEKAKAEQEKMKTEQPGGQVHKNMENNIFRDFKDENNQPPQPGYYIVVGSFLNRDFAKAEVKRLIIEGFKSTNWIYFEPTQFNYVFIRRVNTKEEALKQTINARTAGYEDAWIQRIIE